MKHLFAFLLMITSQIAISQQYDSVFYDKENTDLNNEIYKTGNVYVFEYEIISSGIKHKLQKKQWKCLLGVILNLSKSTLIL